MVDERYESLFAKKKGSLMYAVLFVSFIPLWGLFEQSLPGFRDIYYSIESGNKSDNSGGVVAGATAVVLLVAICIGWHVQHAWKYFRKRDAFMYCGSRCAVVLFYCAIVLIAYKGGARKDEFDVHLPSYIFAWGISLFCQFHHPISNIFLVLCASVFVQSLAVQPDGSQLFSPITSCSSAGMQSLAFNHSPSAGIINGTLILPTHSNLATFLQKHSPHPLNLSYPLYGIYLESDPARRRCQSLRAAIVVRRRRRWRNGLREKHLGCGPHSRQRIRCRVDNLPSNLSVGWMLNRLYFDRGNRKHERK